MTMDTLEKRRFPFGRLFAHYAIDSVTWCEKIEMVG